LDYTDETLEENLATSRRRVISQHRAEIPVAR
jgi:hypothetical protein